jgi:hypothetical protein
MTVLIVVLVMLLAPLTAYAQDGPCPDDLELFKDCNAQAPPYYVVVNRSVQYNYPERPGTGCQPIILKHADCKDCTSAECTAINVETEVCQYLPRPSAGQTHIVYEMCCECAINPDGLWLFRIRLLKEDGTCPPDPENSEWITGLPPGTGIELTPPLVVGGLALIGAALVAAGVLVRRRTLRTA